MVDLPAMTHCRTIQEYREFMLSSERQRAEIAAFENRLLRSDTFEVDGRCAVCDRDVRFAVDYQYCFIASDGRQIPNWRERLVCPHCHLNNRMRAAATFLLAAAESGGEIYLTEQVTPLFRTLKSRHHWVLGSEYLLDGTPRGELNAMGIRHEDATRLTFQAESFSTIGSFDVLEHVPNYHRALAEFFRCLRPGGVLSISVPFYPWLIKTVTRATKDAEGKITHLLPPEMHGDPLGRGGALCFYHFGWDFIESINDAGFTDSGVSFFWEPRLGYLGGYQPMITARKQPRRTL